DRPGIHLQRRPSGERGRAVPRGLARRHPRLRRGAARVLRRVPRGRGTLDLDSRNSRKGAGMKGRLFASLAMIASAVCVAQAVRPAGRTAQTVGSADVIEDEYVRCELLAPSTRSFRITRDLSVVAPGATSYSDASPVDSQLRDVSVVDLMS